MSAGRFRERKNEEDERSLLAQVTPKATQYNTKWARKIFEDWQQNRSNKNPEMETVGYEGVNLSQVQVLNVRLEEMSPYSLNFWLSKFVSEAAKQTGERYPPKTLYLLMCGVNRHLLDVKGEDSFNILAKGDRRFWLFRKSLDGEMKDATRCGIAQICKKETREEITEAEESVLWQKELLGSGSAESLLNTLYFYNGKLFGLRACEHRQLRLCNVTIDNNFIIFDESVSKTFHGGLKDLTHKPRYIKHMCHEIGETHTPCLVSMYSLYISKVEGFGESLESFYFRPHRSGDFKYEKSPVGLSTLNKILPEKLCQKAGLPRKTAHCLRITCASRLFQKSVGEKLTRERTGHRSNALFAYQNPSKSQLDNVSEVLRPCVDSRNTSSSDVGAQIEKVREDEKTGIIVKAKVGDENNSSREANMETFYDYLFDVSDDVLANFPMPESERSGKYLYKLGVQQLYYKFCP